MAEILDGRRIVLGVTGGIAAYKSAELVRLLTRDGATVDAVMTEAATRFVGTATFQALTGRPVHGDLWDATAPGGMAHIDLTRGADALLVAPASADFLARAAHGLADDLLATLVLARDCPLLVAPAMNRQMWENPATQRNLAQLRADGVAVLGPASGDQACGEVGMGRMLEAQELRDALVAFFRPKRLAGRRVLVTAGPTFERIDAVRGITNLSSGRMGYGIAQAALEAGAEVVLVSGPSCIEPPRGARVERVTGALEMLEAVERNLPGTDVFVSVAAVADYRAEAPSEQKIKKSGADLTLRLVPNPDILARVAARPDAPFCVGFAAESERLHEQADEKRRRKRLPLLVGNLAQHAIGADDNEVVLFDDSGAHPLPRAPKLEVARLIVDRIADLCAAWRPGGTP